MHAGDHDVEALEQLGFLVEAAVVEDVDFDAGQYPHRCEPLAEFVDHVELFPKTFR